MAHQLEPAMAVQMRDISWAPGEEIVDAQHMLATLDQAVA